MDNIFNVMSSSFIGDYMEKNIAIIILTCNQEELLKKCLISLKNNTNYKNYKVYVIDDSGKDYLSKKTKNKFKWINFSANTSNLGYSNAINLGIKRVLKEYSPDYLLLLNDDMEFLEKDWLKKMVEVSESNEKIGIVCCKLIYPDGNLQWYYKNGKMHFERITKYTEETEETFKIKEVEDVIGACILIKKKVIDEIGLYDKGFSPLYGEDTDYCYRAGKKGFKLMYIGTTKVMHWNGSWIKGMKNKDAEKRKWFLQKKHAIRLEWLNFNVSNIIKYTIIHFGSIATRKDPLEGLKLLAVAYKENFKDLSEIRKKRGERFSWKNSRSKVISSTI